MDAWSVQTLEQKPKKRNRKIRIYMVFIVKRENIVASRSKIRGKIEYKSYVIWSNGLSPQYKTLR